jgi:toxin ParE1/3/4
MAKYILTEPADTDLDEILSYVAKENIDAALALNDKFTNRFEMLAENPKAGRERKEFRHDARSFPEGNYLIICRLISPEDIEILRVLHGARDLDEIFN